MLPFLRENYGNPSSLHTGGTAVRRRVEEARADIARFIGAVSNEQILFTSGATESIALAFASINREAAQIVTSTVEHSAVLAATKRWANGRPIVSIPVNSQGLLDMERLKNAVGHAPSFVSLMLANNETGVLFDIGSVAQLCHQHRAVFHVDAAQGFGKVAVNVREFDCDYLSLSAHKFHGPKGSGVCTSDDPHKSSRSFPDTRKLTGVREPKTSLASSAWRLPHGRWGIGHRACESHRRPAGST